MLGLRKCVESAAADARRSRKSYFEAGEPDERQAPTDLQKFTVGRWRHD